MDIRPAATLVLVRDSGNGPEVLMLQRTWEAIFMPGFYVFPGGAVDESDQQCRDHMTGRNDETVSQIMSLDEGGADFMIAALRECFEEAGILLADGHTVDHYEAERTALNRGEDDFYAFCRRHDLSLPLDRLGYLAHWVTPPGPPRRFDTRFFVAAMPEGQSARHDGIETIDHVWLTPQQALADHESGARLMGPPTVRTLRVLSDFDSVDEILAYAHANPPEPEPTKAWPGVRKGKPVLVEPGAPAFDELCKLDPEGKGDVLAEIVPGSAVEVGYGVYRLTAPNAGMMTGPGTNTYVLGDHAPYTVIDPGPDDPAHLEQILALTGGQIEQVLVTHTHRDHSPGAVALKEKAGARLVGMTPPDDPSQDKGFQPDHSPEHGETLSTTAGELKVLHTPGHASNHLCYLLAGEQMLFSGDHIMQGSTVVINPPDGDMLAYLKSLALLLNEDIRYIAPGHGFLMGDPHGIVDYLTTHRLAREHKVMKALAASGPGTLAELVAHAYEEVPKALHPLAQRSLLAHLLKLEQDGRARQDADQRWSVASA